MENDFSLLRPFDLEAAKRGELVQYKDHSELLRYVDGPNKVGEVCVNGDEFGFAVVDLNTRGANLRMAPLCWVEGKPVYKGDCLYNRDGEKVIVEEFKDGVIKSLPTPLMGCSSWSNDYLTWQPPKVKREGWVNIYPSGSNYRGEKPARTDGAYSSQHDADLEAGSARLACVRIEWEEPAA